MQAVVCKGRKGICTWRQAGLGRQAEIMPFRGSINKCKAPGRHRRRGGCRGRWKSWAGGLGSGAGESTWVTGGHICSPLPHPAVWSHLLQLLGALASAGNVDSSGGWGVREESKERNSSNDHSAQDTSVFTLGHSQWARQPEPGVLGSCENGKTQVCTPSARRNCLQCLRGWSEPKNTAILWPRTLDTMRAGRVPVPPRDHKGRNG